MAVIWCVAGAGRGVGKTTLVKGLCEILPRSVAAKHGHSPARDDRQPNYFTTLTQIRQFIEQTQAEFEHIVIESNALVLRRSGDVHIVLAPRQGQTNVRADCCRLLQAADIRIDATCQQENWQAILMRVGLSKTQRSAVIGRLSLQADFLAAEPLTVGTKVWLEVNGQNVFGEGVAQLVAQIRKTGSLQEASRALGMSYRYAWEKIRKAEKRLGRPLVCRRVGGAHGGGSTLTAEGERLLSLYERVQKAVTEQAQASLNTCDHPVRSSETIGG